RACERWHVTPGTWGSSKALTQILSFAPRTRNVVDTQPMSSACSRPTAPLRSTTQSIQSHLYPCISCPPARLLRSLSQYRRTQCSIALRRLQRAVPETHGPLCDGYPPLASRHAAPLPRSLAASHS